MRIILDCIKSDHVDVRKRERRNEEGHSPGRLVSLPVIPESVATKELRLTRIANIPLGWRDEAKQARVVDIGNYFNWGRPCLTRLAEKGYPIE